MTREEILEKIDYLEQHNFNLDMLPYNQGREQIKDSNREKIRELKEQLAELDRKDK